MIGRFLCRIGLHRWEWKTTFENSPRYGTELVVRCSCRRPGCPEQDVFADAQALHR